MRVTVAIFRVHGRICARLVAVANSRYYDDFVLKLLRFAFERARGHGYVKRVEYNGLRTKNGTHLQAVHALRQAVNVDDDIAFVERCFAARQQVAHTRYVRTDQADLQALKAPCLHGLRCGVFAAHHVRLQGQRG